MSVTNIFHCSKSFVKTRVFELEVSDVKVAAILGSALAGTTCCRLTAVVA